MEVRNLSMKEWADEDKPREKLLANGKKALTNAELVAILLHSGSRGQSAVELAKRVLERCGNSLATLSKLEAAELRKFKGLGEAKAVTLLAALELGYRMLRENNENNEHYAHSSIDIYNYIAPSIVNLEREEFWVIFLTNSLKISGRQCVAMGGMTSVNVDLRLLMRSALEHNATRIALAHNHPTGKITPSREDKALTAKVIEAARLLGIEVIDHLVVGLGPETGKNYYSFKDNGLI